jgi:hypothetical protein
MISITINISEEQNMFLEELKQLGIPKSFIIRQSVDLLISSKMKKLNREKNKKYSEMLKSLMDKE